jgi:transposase-like protein
MPHSILDEPHLRNEEAAYAHVEARIWRNGRMCPHCGVIGSSGKLKGKSTRIGVYKCYTCRKPFTVKIGTIFEASHVPMHLWLQTIVLMCSSKKGISTNQLHRTLGVTLRTAWHLSHRIREAMRSDDMMPFGGGGGDVEVDETFIWTDPDARPTPEHANPSWVEKIKILGLVDRETGKARNFVVDSLSAKDVAPILDANISREARLLTDEARRYIRYGRRFASHASVHHASEEYVSADDPTVHINTIEGYFSIFKRGMTGVYQHCAKEHMHRYLAEFDFRYSNRVALGIGDAERAERAISGAVGKRLTYRTVNRQASETGLA